MKKGSLPLTLLLGCKSQVSQGRVRTHTHAALPLVPVSPQLGRPSAGLCLHLTPASHYLRPHPGQPPVPSPAPPSVEPLCEGQAWVSLALGPGRPLLSPGPGSEWAPGGCPRPGSVREGRGWGLSGATGMLCILREWPAPLHTTKCR